MHTTQILHLADQGSHTQILRHSVELLKRYRSLYACTARSQSVYNRRYTKIVQQLGPVIIAIHHLALH